MNYQLGLCYRLTTVNGNVLEFKFIGDSEGLPQGQLFDGNIINLLTVGAFKKVEQIDCPK